MAINARRNAAQLKCWRLMRGNVIRLIKMLAARMKAVKIGLEEDGFDRTRTIPAASENSVRPVNQ